MIARELKSPPRSFHEVFLQALHPSFTELAAKNSMLLAEQLQHFLGRHFASLVGNAAYARHILEQIQHMRMEAPVPKDQDVFLKQSSSLSNQYISFMELKTTLLLPPMISQRLASHDAYALNPSLKTSAPQYNTQRHRLILPTTDRSSAMDRAREFRANVCKRSRKWLGGPPRSRILIVKEHMVELFKKGDTKKASMSVTVDTIESITTTQLEFVIRTKDGDALILTCDSIDGVRQCVSEVATHCLFHALDTGQPATELGKFLACGARLNDRSRLSPTLLRANLLSIPTSALGMAYIMDERSHTRDVQSSRVATLLAAGAKCHALLRWSFASLFFLRKTPLSRNVLDYFLQHELPLETAGDDAHSWSLLQYLCLMRNVSSVERFLQVVDKASVSRMLAHVNGAGDSVLHVAIKHDEDMDDAELIACLLLKPLVGSAKSPAKPLGDDSTTTSIAMDHCAWINHVDQMGDTVIHAALKAKMWKCVESLVALHASTSATDAQVHAVSYLTVSHSSHKGNTAVHLALKMHAPYPLLCRIVRASKLKRGATPKDDCLERRDGRGDTALTLALKLRNEAAVLRLLECGAQPDVLGCIWDHHNVLGGGGDSPLHVAIKTGLPNAARALVLHGATADAVDAHGASVLSLALRHGMYSLAYEIILVLAVDQDDQPPSSTADDVEATNKWLDLQVGDSVVGLALKAGQLELAALLLDLCPATLHVAHIRTLERPLHHVMKLREWLDYIEPKASQPPHARQKKAKQTRHHVKSKSDGDLTTLLVGDWATVAPYDAQAHLFVQRTLEGMLLGMVKQVDPALCVSCPVMPTTEVEPIYHLVNSDDCITDHQVDCFTPLHAAARGGLSTNHILRWFLLQLTDASLPQTLGVTIGPLAATPLHEAIVSASTENAIDLLDFIAAKPGAHDVVNAVRADLASALHLACHHAKLKPMQPILGRLLAMDHVSIETEGWDDAGRTPLHVAVEHGADDALVRLFHASGADLNTRTEDGRTPLMVALQANNDVAFQTLLALGANAKLVMPGTRHGLRDLAAAIMDDPSGLHPVFASLVHRSPSDATPQDDQVPLSPPNAIRCRRLSDEMDEVTTDSVRGQSYISISRLSSLMPKEDIMTNRPEPNENGSTSPPLVYVGGGNVGDPKAKKDAVFLFGKKESSVATPDDHAWLGRLKEDEKATLHLVAVEARQQAREWLCKRVGKQKILSDSLLLTQQHYAQHGVDLDPTTARLQAEKLFIDRHVADMVSEARLEIEREKQNLLYEATRVSMKDPVAASTRPPSALSTASSSTTFLLESFIGHADDDSLRGSLDLIDFEPRKTLC
ncbi:Aste57867_788 [Aphanomyces stellatus]|uniref:Aste57867_788 protein n=1 Tax=Aphanomyces stellatus TaxID=120398 RepID=A0A485K3H0_9STRA|nr:hypothetical protein As57867_000787 [Aphanomyces stellatus]VFT78012.1 Aste57867_788 [Aphanomyces stellatus]